MNKTLKKTIWIVGIFLILIQLIPVERSNPPVTGEISSRPEVKSIMERSCYDCHSNQTNWPWYAHIAPVSFFVVHDVEDGREHLNFSEWQSYPAEKQKNLVMELLEEVEKGEMPLFMYTIMHSNANLSEGELDTLRKWAETDYGVKGD